MENETSATTSASSSDSRGKVVRRQLDLRTLADVLAEFERLHAGRYARAGTWDLATMCDHIDKALRVGMAGTPVPLPMAIRILGRVFGGLVYRRIVKTRRFPTGVSIPKPFVPEMGCDAAGAIGQLRETVRSANAFAGPLKRHPLFGRITVDEWRELMVIHAQHHLSFLVPVE